MNASRNVVEQKILTTDFQTFRDASREGVSATVCAVLEQPSGTNQGLVMAKSWLPKKELTIPLLELLAGQMATYLAQNIKEVLEGFRVRTVYGWLDTSVTLHWIHGNRKCKQLVRNWVRNIQVKQINCRHVPTEENPRESQMCGVGEEMLTDRELFGGRDQADYHNHRTGHQTL